MPAPGRARARPASTGALLLVLLLVLTVGVAGVLAYEAHQAARAQRVTADRALRDHATFAARELAARATESLHEGVAAALRPATAGRASSPFEPLMDPALLAPAARAALPCATGDDAARPVLAVELGTGRARVAGSAPEDVMRWARDTVVAHARAAFRPGWPWAVVLGAGEMRGRAVVYGVRFAEMDVPVSAYAVVTCAAAVTAPLARAVAADTLLRAVARDAGGGELARSAAGAPDAADDVVEVALDRLGGARLAAALRPEAARAWEARGPARARLPMLLGLLALTAGLAAIALAQLRREHELARLRADFTSSVSHELRTPLAQILLYAETLSLGRVRSAAEGREAAETIVQEARRLMHVVDNVLHFARASRGGNGAHPAPVALLPVARATVAAFAPLAAGRGVVVRLEGEGDPVAMAEEGAVRQILLNLLDNAVKYGPDGQTVTVRLSAADRARIEVEDEGAGIAPQDRERIWHPFVRAALAPVPGSGIGLAVVRELAESLGGSALVEEAGTGRGARFVVELPAAAAVADPRPAAIVVPDDEVARCPAS